MGETTEGVRALSTWPAGAAQATLPAGLPIVVRPVAMAEFADPAGEPLWR
jgi:hypothetical protein